MITEKDKFILEILEKVTLANNWQLMILGGYRDPSVVRKRLNRLKSEGYISSGWLGDHLVYTLKQAGLSELEKTRKPYDIRGIKSEHEELVTEAACYVYIKAGRSITEMLFDHELNSLKEVKETGHKPDIVFSLHQAVEVELSHKQMFGTGSKSGLEDNFLSNAEFYSRQLWIVPEHKPGLRARIQGLAKKHGVEKSVSIISVENMKKAVKEYVPSNNKPMLSPVKGRPSIKKPKEVKLND